MIYSKIFSFGNFLMAKTSEHPDSHVSKHLMLPNLCINNSRRLANKHTIDKYDIKPAVMKRSGAVSVYDIIHNYM